MKVRSECKARRQDIPWRVRVAVFESSDYRCVYCTEAATAIDHVVPWSLTADDSMDNLVATCGKCNSIAGSGLFSSFAAKRAYILNRRAEKGLPAPDLEGAMAMCYRAHRAIERACKREASEAEIRQEVLGWPIGRCPLCGATFGAGRDGASNLLCGKCYKAECAPPDPGSQNARRSRATPKNEITTRGTSVKFRGLERPLVRRKRLLSDRERPKFKSAQIRSGKKQIENADDKLGLRRARSGLAARGYGGPQARRNSVSTKKQGGYK